MPLIATRSWGERDAIELQPLRKSREVKRSVRDDKRKFMITLV